jgi:predicted MFS family arabinose efflux permease
VGIGVFGLGTISFVYMGPVLAWFDKSRGLALGIAASGVSITAMLAPPLMQMLIEDVGWRAGYWALACLATLVGLPLALVLLRPRPRTLQSPTEGHQTQGAAHSVEVKAALRSPVFWLLAFALFCINTAGVGVVSQLSPMLEEKGLTTEVAAWGITAYALGLMIGRLGCGVLLDHAPMSRVAFLFTILPAFGALILLLPAPLVGVALGAALIIGLQQGSEVDIVAFAISHSFGMLKYTSIFGLIYIVGNLGNSFGAFAAGALFDLTGNYDLALSAIGTLFGMGALSFLLTGVGVARRAL